MSIPGQATLRQQLPAVARLYNISQHQHANYQVDGAVHIFGLGADSVAVVSQ